MNFKPRIIRPSIPLKFRKNLAPMGRRESLLQDLARQLRAVPEERRKVIILVGRQPNEGTATIAQRHFLDWANMGAVTVQIPPEWTPHGFWQNQLLNLSESSIHSTREIPLDRDIVKFLAEEGFDVPVINFHGTLGTNGAEPSDGRRALDFFHNGYGRIPWHYYFSWDNKSRLHDNEVLAEYYARGRETKLSERLRRHLDEKMLWANPHHEQVDVGYLEDPRFTRDDIRLFSEKFARKFLEVVEHLALNGLKQPCKNQLRR